MATPTPTRLLTAEEFYEQYATDERDLELVDGRVVEMSRPSWYHDVLATRIANLLGDFASQHDLGIAAAGGGFVVSRGPDVVRGPDASFLSKRRIPAEPTARPYIDGGPDLAVEVISPNELDRNVNRKLAEYLDAGTQRVWIVRVEPRTVTVHRPDGTARTYGIDDTLTSDDADFIIDGFELPVRYVFA